MYQNYAGNFSHQSIPPRQWSGYTKPEDEFNRTNEFDTFSFADDDFGDTSSPLVRQGILPPVHIIVNADNATINSMEFPSVAAFFEERDEAPSSLDANNWFVPDARSDAGEEFITYIRHMPDGTKIFVHTPANEEGVVQKVVQPDGTIIEHYSNGDKITEFPNHAADGLAYSLESRDGSRIYEYVDGSRVILKSDGTTSFEHADNYQGNSAA
jgi:hypothetical protein